VLHNELIRDFPSDGQLAPVEEVSTPRFRHLWCSGCGREIACALQTAAGLDRVTWDEIGITELEFFLSRSGERAGYRLLHSLFLFS